jgi:hypothetical protein
MVMTKKVLLVVGVVIGLQMYSQDYPGSFYVGDIKGKVCSITRESDSTWVVKYTDTGKTFISKGVPTDFIKAGVTKHNNNEWLETRSGYVINQYKKQGYVVVNSTVNNGYHSVVLRNGNNYTMITSKGEEILSITHSN